MNKGIFCLQRKDERATLVWATLDQATLCLHGYDNDRGTWSGEEYDDNSGPPERHPSNMGFNPLIRGGMGRYGEENTIYFPWINYREDMIDASMFLNSRTILVVKKPFRMKWSLLSFLAWSIGLGSYYPTLRLANNYQRDNHIFLIFKVPNNIEWKGLSWIRSL